MTEDEYNAECRKVREHYTRDEMKQKFLEKIPLWDGNSIEEARKRSLEVLEARYNKARYELADRINRNMKFN